MIFLSGDVFATGRGVLPVEVVCEQNVFDLLNCGVELNPLGGVSLHSPSMSDSKCARAYHTCLLTDCEIRVTSIPPATNQSLTTSTLSLAGAKKSMTSRGVML